MNDKIKIVYLIDSFLSAGAENLLLNICRKIDKTKFDVSVAAVVCGGPLEAEFNKLDINVKVFNKKAKYDIGLIFDIYKFLKQIKPDIVHTHLFGADTWGRIAAILAKVPRIISTEHNMNINHSWLQKKIRLVLSWFSTNIIAVSAGVKNYSAKVEKINRDKIEVIYNGIDLDSFRFRGFDPIKPDQPIKAIIMARLTKQKGHQYLFKAIPMIIKKYPQFVLHIYGIGDLEKKLKKLAQELKIENNIKFKGETQDSAQVLAQMDLLILPSVWEGLGVVLLESQAIGLPVLAADIIGPKEVINNGKNGLLFEAKNPQAISDSVTKLISDTQLQENMIVQARKDVEQKFDLNQMVELYSNLYLKITQNV
jgi:glycosyltransferase involved in cell wall biosynthesis